MQSNESNKEGIQPLPETETKKFEDSPRDIYLIYKRLHVGHPRDKLCRRVPHSTLADVNNFIKGQADKVKILGANWRGDPKRRRSPGRKWRFLLYMYSPSPIASISICELRSQYACFRANSEVSPKHVLMCR